MSLVSIQTTRANIANVSSVLAEANIRVGENSSAIIGYGSATQLTGSFNTIFGYNAAKEAKTGNFLTIFGYAAGTNSSGDYNTFMGTSSGSSTTSGSNNVFLGAKSGEANTTGSANTYIGTEGGLAATGNANVLIGCSSGSIASTTSCNVGIGYSCSAGGGGSVGIGFRSRTSGRNSIVIGSGIVNSGSNACILHTGANTLTNSSPGFLHIAGRIIGETMSNNNNVYEVRCVADKVRLAYNHATLIAAVDVSPEAVYINSEEFFSRSINLERISIQNATVPGTSNTNWQMRCSAPYRQRVSDKFASDLIFQSVNSNTVSFTDEFAPELFNFTGKHRCTLLTSGDDEYGDGEGSELQAGRIVVSCGKYENLDGAGAIDVDEAIPVVAISSTPMNPRVFGVTAGWESAINSKNASDTQRTFRLGHLRFSLPKSDGHRVNKVIINSLGEGGIWVCGENGAFTNGDYICSSSRPGTGMRQSSSAQHNYTVAKITCDCDFSDPNEEKFVGCTYRC